MDETGVHEDLIREENAAAKKVANEGRSCCCGKSPELARFDKALYECREVFRTLGGRKGTMTLTVSFEGGRITHLQKEFTEE